MGNFLINLFTRGDFVAKASSLTAKLTEISLKEGTQKLLQGAGPLVGAAGLVGAGMSAASGQSKGTVGDIFTGFVDLNQEGYHDDGQDQSGTMLGTAGKFLQNIGIAAFNLSVKAAKNGNGILKNICKCDKRLAIVEKVTQGMMLWQTATVAHEFMRPDGDGIEDTADKVGGVMSVMSLAASLGTLGKFKGQKLLTWSGGAAQKRLTYTPQLAFNG